MLSVVGETTESIYIMGYNIFLMFQVFPSMKSQPQQISLTRLSQILPEPKPHPLTEAFETIMLVYFNDDDVPAQRAGLAFKQIDSFPLTKKECINLLNKPLLKMLKKEEKKIEELVLFHRRSGGQQQANRLKLDRVLRECFSKIENICVEIYTYINQLQRINKWECVCKKASCLEQKSLVQFTLDIFGFFYRSSKILQEQIEFSIDREAYLNDFYYQVDGPGREYWKGGYRTGELLLQMERNYCELSKSQKKKLNKRKQKMEALVYQRQDAVQQKEEVSQQKEEVVQVKEEVVKQKEKVVEEKKKELDEDEQALNLLIESLEIKEEKRPCHVTEEWLAKIRDRVTSFKK